jgi:hypothetical protein
MNTLDDSATPAAPKTWWRRMKWQYAAGAGIALALVVASAAAASSSSLEDASNPIGCDVTITGTHAAFNIVSGTTCIVDAHITGGISIAKGAVLDSENSTVSGSISANAPAGLRICGSHTGAITVSASTGLVVIGDPNNCAANTITGSILAANNKAGVIIVGNTVSGSVTSVNNSGIPVIVSGNHH